VLGLICYLINLALPRNLEPQACDFFLCREHPFSQRCLLERRRLKRPRPTVLDPRDFHWMIGEFLNSASQPGKERRMQTASDCSARNGQKNDAGTPIGLHLCRWNQRYCRGGQFVSMAIHEQSSAHAPFREKGNRNRMIIHPNAAPHLFFFSVGANRLSYSGTVNSGGPAVVLVDAIINPVTIYMYITCRRPFPTPFLSAFFSNTIARVSTSKD